MNNPRTDPGVRCLERDRISGRLESEHRPSEARHARQGGLQRGGRSTAGANRGSSNGPYRYTSSFSLITAAGCAFQLSAERLIQFIFKINNSTTQ